MGLMVGPRIGVPGPMVAQTDGSQVCRQDPDLWFSSSTGDRAQARAACNTCPFLNACRLEGLLNHEEGTWGGLSESQRTRMGLVGRQREIDRLQNLLAQERNLRQQESEGVA